MRLSIRSYISASMQARKIVTETQKRLIVKSPTLIEHRGAYKYFSNFLFILEIF